MGLGSYNNIVLRMGSGYIWILYIYMWPHCTTYTLPVPHLLPPHPAVVHTHTLPLFAACTSTPLPTYFTCIHQRKPAATSSHTCLKKPAAHHYLPPSPMHHREPLPAALLHTHNQHIHTHTLHTLLWFPAWTVIYIYTCLDSIVSCLLGLD